MGIGEWAALAAALLWTVASMLWGRIHLSAWSLNLCKNAIGAVLVALHLLVLMLWFGGSGFTAPWQSWGWLALSGLFGLVLGDTLYFRCLQILGPRRALMMATTGPIFSAMLGWVLLRESLIPIALAGIALAVTGVAIVVADRKATLEAPGLRPGRIRMGIATGILATICQSVGGVFSKLGMRDSEGVEICTALEATFIRLLLSAVAMFVIVVAKRQLTEIIRQVIAERLWRLIIPATVIGTWLGVWVSLIAFNHSKVALAQTLMSTCPLFAIPIMWIAHRQQVTIRSLIGTLVALIGIGLVVWYH